MSSVQNSSGSVVDVRTIVPRDRHPLVVRRGGKVTAAVGQRSRSPSPLSFLTKASIELCRRGWNTDRVTG